MYVGNFYKHFPNYNFMILLYGCKNEIIFINSFYDPFLFIHHNFQYNTMRQYGGTTFKKNYTHIDFYCFLLYSVPFLSVSC